MSNIKKLLKSDDSILVFDVDGVLAMLEFGEHNHYEMNDEEWDKTVENGTNFYTEDKVSDRMQKFLSAKDKSRVYVITTVGSSIEGEYKKLFVNKYYNILTDNVYCVDKDQEKVNELIKIKEKYSNLEDYKIVMIDDTVSVLSEVMEKTSFSTAHISSFLDI